MNKKILTTNLLAPVEHKITGLQTRHSIRHIMSALLEKTNYGNIVRTQQLYDMGYNHNEIQACMNEIKEQNPDLITINITQNTECSDGKVRSRKNDAFYIIDNPKFRESDLYKEKIRELKGELYIHISNHLKTKNTNTTNKFFMLYHLNKLSKKIQYKITHKKENEDLYRENAKKVLGDFFNRKEIKSLKQKNISYNVNAGDLSSINYSLYAVDMLRKIKDSKTNYKILSKSIKNLSESKEFWSYAMYLAKKLRNRDCNLDISDAENILKYIFKKNPNLFDYHITRLLSRNRLIFLRFVVKLIQYHQNKQKVRFYETNETFLRYKVNFLRQDLRASRMETADPYNSDLWIKGFELARLEKKLKRITINYGEKAG